LSFQFSVSGLRFGAQRVQHFSDFGNGFINFEAPGLFNQPEFFGDDSLCIEFSERAVRHREELSEFAWVLSRLAFSYIGSDRYRSAFHLAGQPI